MDRERLPHRIHRGHARRREGERCHRAPPHVPAGLRRLHGRDDLDPAVGLTRHAARRPCAHRDRRRCDGAGRAGGRGRRVPRSPAGPSARNARCDRDPRMGVGTPLRGHARPVPRLEMAVLAQRAARTRRCGSGLVGARRTRPTRSGRTRRLARRRAPDHSARVAQSGAARLGGSPERAGPRRAHRQRWHRPAMAVSTRRGRRRRLRVAATAPTPRRPCPTHRRCAVPRAQRAASR